MDFLAVVSGAAHMAFVLAADEPPAAGLQINLFWVLVSSLNFLVFAVLLYLLFGRSVSRMLADRRARIEQGLRDAEQARVDRENAEAERLATLQEARREAKEILDRAQRVAQESRDVIRRGGCGQHEPGDAPEHRSSHGGVDDVLDPIEQRHTIPNEPDVL